MMDRRRFMEACAGVGLGSTLFRECCGRKAQGQGPHQDYEKK